MRTKLYFIASLLLLAFQLQAQKTLTFNGTNQWVNTTFAGVSGSASRTIEMWIRPATTAVTTQKVITDYGATSPNGSRFTTAIQQAGRNFRIEAGGNGNQGTATHNDGMWHHVAVVFDNASASNKFTTYFNGEVDWNGDLTVTINTSSTSTFRIGCRVDNVNFFEGEVDEIKFWNYAKTGTEIQEGMFRPLTGAESGLVAYYNFDGAAVGSGGVPDISPGNHPGTMTGMTASNIVDSYCPIHFNPALFNIVSVWQYLSTNNSKSSGGLVIKAPTALPLNSYVSFGHNNASSTFSGTSTADLPAGVIQRYNQIWHTYAVGTVTANLKFALSAITKSTMNAGSAAGYRLLFRSGSTGNFTDLGPASAIAGTDTVVFNNINVGTGYYTLGTANASSPLPVLFKDNFAAKMIEARAQLTWSTASEINVSTFSILKSTNARDFEVLSVVKAKGQTIGTTSYMEYDNDVARGITYYQLKVTDQDGKTQLSPVVTVNKKGGNDYKVYNLENKVVITSAEKMPNTGNVYTTNGMAVTGNCFISYSGNSIEISTGNLPKGIYIISIGEGVLRFIK